MLIKQILIAPLLFLVTLLCACNSVKNNAVEQSADVVVYGGTSSAVVAAIQAAKEGKSVLLIAPEKHFGAMSSAGLGFTDSGATSVIGGLAREFYHRIWLEYQSSKAWNLQPREKFSAKGQGTKSIDDANELMWIFEPKVAERVYDKWLLELFPNIKFYRNEYLDRENGVEKSGAKILSITTISGKKFVGKIFIDATFEGDLMASASCAYRVGRESNSLYNEDYNGFRDAKKYNYHKFKTNISPYKISGDKSSGLLKYVSDAPILELGAADNKVQAYCFRMCLTNYPPNRIAISKPQNYNPEDYELLARYLQSEPNAFPLIISEMPNFKTDCNNRNAFSTDFIGENYAYPEASYAEREKIVSAHKDYQLGLLYFLSTDPRIPAKTQEKVSQYGLAKDEFVDTQNWSFYLYIREARRLIGDYVMTQHDCQNSVSTPKPIGMGSYTLDSHNTSRHVTPDGFVQNEGDVQVGLKAPYQIAYGSITPKQSECENLLVTCAVSSTHIAYGSIRMEPVFMLLGHSAATAASLAIDDKCPVQKVDYAKLSAKLLNSGQILENAKKK